MHRIASLVFAALCAPAAHAQASAGHDASDHVCHAGHGAHAAPAHVTKGPADDVMVRACWVRNMPANLPSAAYFVIYNKSGHAIEVTGVSSPNYGSVMMHATEFKGGMASMKMASSVPVPARGAFAFQPGGHHVMLEEPTVPRTVGEPVVLMFTLADGHSLQADCTIKPASAVGP